MKKIYTFFAIFMFLATAGTAFAANPAIQLTGSTPINDTQVKLEAFYSLGDAKSLDLYFYWDNICGVFTNQSPVQRVTNTSGYITYTVSVPKSGTYCYKVSGMKHMADGTSDFIDSGSPSYKEFKTTNSGTTTNATVQNTGATSVTQTSALLNAYYTSGGASNSSIYFMYGPVSSGAIYKSNTLSQYSSNGDVATTITGLSAGTNYVYRAYITTTVGTFPASNTGTFTTAGSNNTNTCVIDSFYASPSSIYSGNTATLYWTTTNCTSANLNTAGGSVSVNGTYTTGVLYSSTTYTLNAYGNNGSDSKTASIGVSPNNNNNNNWGNTYPTCYYTYTCYWNGTSWVYTNNNNNYYPNNNVNTYSGTYPSCYYDATCYWSGSTWVYNAGGNVSGNYSPYTYNPHTPYTGGPNYVTRTVSGGVRTVYVDEPVTNYVPSNTIGYDTNIMSRYSANYYDGNVNNRVLLTGSAGSAGEITLIGLLIAIIIILIIVYVIKSTSEKNNN